MSNEEKIKELDMRYRLALSLLVFCTNKHIDYFIDTIDKAVGHKYFNFAYNDEEEQVKKEIK